MQNLSACFILCAITIKRIICLQKEMEEFLVYISVGGGRQGELKPPKLGRNPFHSGKLSERTTGNSHRKCTDSLQPP